MLFWLLLSSVLVFLCLVVSRLALRVVTVQGQSMAPTLLAGDRLLVCRCWPTRWLRRGHLVLIGPPEGGADASPWFIKRLVGLPGDTLVTSINEVPEHLRLSHLAWYDAQGHRAWEIPPGHIFVRGDNRDGSVDSTAWGPLPARQVQGIVMRRFARTHHQPTIPPVGLPIGLPAPHFRAKTLDGKAITLANYRGRCAVFLFILPSQFCQAALTEYLSLAPQAARAGVTLVLVSAAELEPTRRFVSAVAPALPTLVAPRRSNPFVKNYHIDIFPWFCLLDKQGKVQATGPTVQGRCWRELTAAWERQGRE